MFLDFITRHIILAMVFGSCPLFPAGVPFEAHARFLVGQIEIKLRIISGDLVESLYWR